VVALGLDQRLVLPRWINELGFQGLSPLGARWSAYIVLPNEYGPSDQTNINRTVFLNPLGQWSMIREVEADWPSGEARSASRSFPWLMDSSRCWIIAVHVNISV